MIYVKTKEKMMEEQLVEKKVLFISPAVQALIPDVPRAKELLEQLEREGYEVKDIVEYGKLEDEFIGAIVTGKGENYKTYQIRNTEGLVQVLSIFLSPANSNAPHSPPAERGFQQGGREPNILRMSGDGKSIDGEDVVAGGDIKLTGLHTESKSSSSWCSWFTRCCDGDDERNPLLSSEDRTPVQVQKK